MTKTSLSKAEMQRLSSVIHKPRDKALFYFMTACGLSIKECLRIQRADLDLSRHTLQLKTPSETVYDILLPDEVVSALEAYLNTCPSLGVDLFSSNRPGCTSKSFTRQGLYMRFETYFWKANLPVHKWRFRVLQTKALQTTRVKSLIESKSLPYLLKHLSNQKFRNGQWRKPYYRQFFQSPYLFKL